MAQVCYCSVSSKITRERTEEIRKAAELTDKIRAAGGLSICDRTYRLKKYKQCFVASELVKWLIDSGEAEGEEQAVELGQLLVNTDYIHHVVDEHNFENGYLFFRFRQDEPPEQAFQGPSVAFMRGQEGALISLLAKRRIVLGWTYYTFVLSPSSTLYQYRSELDSAPLQCYSLENGFIQPENPKGNCKVFAIMHVFSKTKTKLLTLGADSSETQFTWLQAFSARGLEILPSVDEADEMVKNARSIFDFKATDIDGNVVSLDRYRGHVTLIVNVASQ